MANTLNKVNRGDFDRLLWSWLSRRARGQGAGELGVERARATIEKSWQDIMNGRTALPKEFVVEINERIRNEGGTMEDVIDYRDAQGRLGKQDLYNWYNDPPDWDKERLRDEAKVGGPPAQVQGRHGSFPLLNRVRNPDLSQEDARSRLNYAFDTKIDPVMPGREALAQSKVDQAMARAEGMRNTNPRGIGDRRAESGAAISEREAQALQAHRQQALRAESGAAVSEEEARALQAQRQGNITGWGPAEQGVVDLKKRFADQIRALRDRF